MSVFSLEGKVAIVTGGSKGIGRGIAKMFAEFGADVCISARGKKDLESTRKEIEQHGHRVMAISGDIMNDDDLERVVSETASELGGVDVLVNNALYSNVDQGTAKMAKVTKQEYMNMIQGNVWAPVRLAQLCRPLMIERGGGVIINISSNSGMIGDEGLGAYPHSKAALNNVTRQLAKEWGKDKIRVVGIAPGLIRTPLVSGEGGLIQYLEDKGLPSLAIDGSIGEPEEIASVALLLASQAGRYVNGQTFVVDGGELIRGVAMA